MFSFGIIAQNFEVFENDVFYCKVLWMVGKAAKNEIQKPSTCRATLFRCKFWIDVSRFSPCVINLSGNKNICCELKKCSALIG